MASDLPHYRAGVASLLALALKLSVADQDRIRHAVRRRGNPDDAAAILRRSDAEHVGDRFLATLLDADADLLRSEVGELEAMIERRLAALD